MIAFDTFLIITSQPASACSCFVPRPGIYEQSTAIFVGRVAEKDGGSPVDYAIHVTFDVQKSWRGIDAKTVRVHLNEPECSTPFLDNEDYLVFAYLDRFEVKMKACSGTSWMGNVEHLEPDISYLNEHYTPIALTERTNMFEEEGWLLFLGVFVGISTAAFFVIAKGKRSMCDELKGVSYQKGYNLPPS